MKQIDIKKKLEAIVESIDKRYQYDPYLADNEYALDGKLDSVSEEIKDLIQEMEKK